MATNTAINLEFQRMGQSEARHAWQVACAAAVVMLYCQQVVAADSTAAPAQTLNSANSDDNKVDSQNTRNMEWMITPSLGLEETYSDNVGLEPRGNENSDWITQINPGLTMTHNASNLKVNANYRMQNIFYAKNTKGHSTFQQLDANANVKLIDDLLFLDGTAGISQQNISALGPLASDNTNVTGNRTNVRTYSIVPYLQHRFHDIASGELRYTHGEVATGEAGLANSQTNNILLSLNSGTAFKTLGWGLNYSNQRMSYTQSVQSVSGSESENFSGTLRYLVTSHLTLFATGGHEKYNYLSIGQEPNGSTISAGFSWAPSARTAVEATAGHRFFGDTYSLKASHRSHRVAWNLEYNEDITTTQSQFLIPATIDTAAFLNNLFTSSIPDPAVRQQIVDAYISSMGLPASLANPINYFTNRIFLQKRLQASVALTGKKNTIMFSIYDESRKAQTSATMDSALLGTGFLASNDDTRQMGVSAIWNLRLSARTSANASAMVSGTGGNNYIKSFKAGISRQLQPGISGSVDLRLTQQNSDQSNSDYQESAIVASLLMRH